jgi:hypothetical protein
MDALSRKKKNAAISLIHALMHKRKLQIMRHRDVAEAREDDIEASIRGYDREQQRTLRRDDLDPQERHARAARLLRRMARLKARRDDLKAK